MTIRTLFSHPSAEQPRNGLQESSYPVFDSLEYLWGAAVIATDGKIGRVEDFLFDDGSWTIRYIVVNLESWLRRREVLIAAAVLGLPDWKQKVVTVNLTRDEVRHSPGVNSKMPVSRQQEAAMSDYYGWPRYSRSGANPEVAMAWPAAGREFPVATQEDPHLRSALAVCGHEVWAAHEKIGTLEDFFADEHSWHIGYLNVKTGDWLHSRNLMIPTSRVKGISWAKHRVSLRGSRESH